MNKLSGFYVLAITAVFLLLSNISFAGDDAKMYNFYQIKYKVNDSLDLFVQPDTRFRDDMGDLYYYHVRNGVVFHAHKNLDLGTTYRFARNENSSGAWLDEHRLELDFTPKVTLSGFNLSNRGRFEHQWLEAAKNRWRYRNLIKAAYPTQIYGFEFTPYISEEVFYDFETEKVPLNWADLGVDKKVSKNLLLGLFYKNELTRVGAKNEWDTNHYLGTKAVLSF